MAWARVCAQGGERGHRGSDRPFLSPQYFKYEFPEGVDSVIVKVTSAMAFPCSVISIQDILVGLGGGTSIRVTRDARWGLTPPLPPQCPVYDLDNNVAFIGMYQTMTKKAAITVQVGTGLCCGAQPPEGVPAAWGSVGDPRLGSADPHFSPPCDGRRRRRISPATASTWWWW